MSFQLITLVPLQHHNTDTVCLSFQPGNSLFNREEIGSHYPQYISLFDGPLHVTAFLSLHTALRRHPTCPGWMPPLALRCVISLVDDFSSIPSWSLCIFLFNFYLIWIYRSDQIRSVAQSCPTLRDPMNRSTPGLPVHHQLPEFTQSIESEMPSSRLILCRPLLLLPPIPPSIRVFSNESALRMRWPKYWSFSFSIIPSKEIPCYQISPWV